MFTWCEWNNNNNAYTTAQRRTDMFHMYTCQLSLFHVAEVCKSLIGSLLHGSWLLICRPHSLPNRAERVRRHLLLRHACRNTHTHTHTLLPPTSNRDAINVSPSICCTKTTVISRSAIQIVYEPIPIWPGWLFIDICPIPETMPW